MGTGIRLVVEAEGARVEVPSRFAAELIERRLGDALRVATGGSVRFSVKSDTASGDVAGRGASGETPIGRVPSRRGRSRAANSGSGSASGAGLGQTLSDFVVGTGNRFAYTAIARIASGEQFGGQPQGVPTGPVFLYGPCGVGKTHLLNAAAAGFRANFPGARTRIASAESFTNEFMSAIRSNTIEAFHRRYRRVDLLCIDDVHFLANKEGTQKELLHTFDQVGQFGGRIVLASDEHPGRVRQFSEALVSRFVSGSLIRIDRPDGETRRRLIESFGLQRGLMLEPAAVAMIDAVAECETGGRGPSVRDLSGLVNRVSAYLSVMGGGLVEGRVPASVVEGAVRAQGGMMPGGSSAGESGGGLGRSGRGHGGNGGVVGCSGPGHGGSFGAGRPVPIGAVIERVCESLEVTKEDLGSRGRHPRVVLARAAVAIVARRLTRNSYPEIAAAMGRRNHSTVITAHRRIEKQIAESQAVAVGLSVDGLPIAALVERIEREARASA